MAFWVYILQCADGSYYTGHTDNLEMRIQQHHAGAIASCYTLNRRPLKLVFSQDFPTREEALASEQQIKGWSRKKKEAMMRGDWAEVSRLAKSKTVRPEPVEGRKPESPVRPEPVEGQTTLIKIGEPSVHPSTSSGRTDGEALP
jgi:predicted GIY-YIG superfamily endonuclease